MLPHYTFWILIWLFYLFFQIPNIVLLWLIWSDSVYLWLYLLIRNRRILVTDIFVNVHIFNFFKTLFTLQRIIIRNPFKRHCLKRLRLFSYTKVILLSPEASDYPIKFSNVIINYSGLFMDKYKGFILCIDYYISWFLYFL